MGKCYSKSDAKQSKQHSTKNSMKNNYYFTAVPYYDADIQIENCPSTDLEDYISKIEQEKENFSKKLSVLGLISETIPEIIIEVQKGEILFNGKSKSKKEFLFVRVSLEPKGLIFVTPLSKIDNPE